MSDFTPEPLKGAVVHRCEECRGRGIVDQDGPDEHECETCDGLGEWFE